VSAALVRIEEVRMSLILHFHPLSSFCWKALVALYDNDTAFTPHEVNLGDEASRAGLLKIWPIGKFPVLEDKAKNRIVPETSIIIEYLDQHYPGRTRFIPAEADAALQARMRDRFLDLYVHLPTQRIIFDRLKPADRKEPHGVEEARAQLRTSYRMLDQQLAGGGWAAGEAFGIADCAAAPSLYYGNLVEPFDASQRNLARYLERLKARPSFARVLTEAAPYFHLFPKQ
jgi:glutathione S-transferase